MKNPNYLICFDLDGVLIHSMQIANQIFFDTVDEELGLPTEEWRQKIEIMAMAGKERFDLCWKKEIKERGISSDQIKKTLQKVHDRKKAIKIPVLPFAVETIKSVAEHFENIACVSSNSVDTIEATLKGMGVRDCFTKISGLDDISFSKPHPEIYEKTVEYFGLEPKNCLTFEDSTHGIHSAKGAGLKVIAVATGLETVSDLKKTPADLILNDLSEFKIERIYKLLNLV